jgi:hypothetical protein
MLVKPHTMNGRVTHKKSMKGNGMGSVLLHGSAGVAGTYTSAAPNPGDLGPPPSGGSLGKSIGAKLDKLRVQSKKKPANIQFSI